MPRFIPYPILSTYDSISKLNANFDQIAALLDRTFLRGTDDRNSFLSPVDANHYNINNLGIATNADQAVSLGQVRDLVAGEVLMVPSAVGSIPDTTTFGTVGDGVTDDTAAIQAALNMCPALRIPAGDYLISHLDIPGDRIIYLDGSAVRFHQTNDTDPGTRMIDCTGDNITVIGDLIGFGRLGQTGDNTGEWNAFVGVVGGIKNVHLGNIIGTNIRGDCFYIGYATGGLGAGPTNVTVGHVVGNNIYRNTATIISGKNIRIESITGQYIGLYMFDIEPDPDAGSTDGVWVGYIKGHHIGLSGLDVNNCLGGIVLETVDIDPAYCDDSTPGYPTNNFSDKQGIAFRQVKDLTINNFRANGFGKGALVEISNLVLPESLITINNAKISNCGVDAAGVGYVSLVGCEMRIGNLHLTTTLATDKFMVSCRNLHIDNLIASAFTGSELFNDVDFVTINKAVVTVNGAGAGCNFIIGSRTVSVLSGTIVADTLLGYGCTDCSLVNVTATSTNYVVTSTRTSCVNVNFGGTSYAFLYFATGASYNNPTFSMDAAGLIKAAQVTAPRVNARVYDLSGHQLLSDQQPNITNAVSAASSATATGLELNQHAASINSILIALRTHGIIAGA